LNRFENRVRRLQVLMSEKDVGGVMIRNVYSFRYFTGVGWWQPALFIPVSGDPTIFAFEDEVDELKDGTWIENVLGYRKVEDLMKGVVSVIKSSGAETLGFDLDIDSSALLYQQFLHMHAEKKVIDAHGMIMELRMIKDEEEVSMIRKASEIAGESLKAALNTVKPGLTETEVAGEAVYTARKMGSESVHIYVNSGGPRIHAHPRNKRIGSQDTVMIDVMPSYGGYYSDKADTICLGSVSDEKKRALQAFSNAVNACASKLKPGLNMEELESEAYRIYGEHGVAQYYVQGFSHGVGLRFEEDPITTIIVAHRRMRIKEGMVLNLGHAPLSGKPIGVVKKEETYLIREGGAVKLT
jgi:Xaa-Pro aminopeptidase